MVEEPLWLWLADSGTEGRLKLSRPAGLLPILNNSAFRKVLWLLLIVTTAAIFLFPVHLSTEYRLMQSPSVFNSLPLFSALFYVWTALLLSLVLLPGSDGGKISLVCIATLVYNGFWKIAFAGIRGASEAYAFAIDMRIIIQSGHIPGVDSPTPLLYGNFPGFDIVGSFLHLVTGLEYIPYLEKAVSLVLYAFATIMLYSIFRNAASDNRFAGMAVMLFIWSNAQITRAYAFQARYMGFCLLLFLIALLFYRKRDSSLFTNKEGSIVLILGMIALTVTHAPSSLFFVFAFVTFFLYPRFLRSPSKSPVRLLNTQSTGISSIPLLLVFSAIVIFSLWELYYAKGIFESTAINVPRSLNVLIYNIKATLNTFFAQSQAHIGPAVPGWVQIAQLFWLLLIIGGGGILTLINLVRMKSISVFASRVTVGALTAIIFTIFVIIMGRSSEEYFRILVFMPIFTVPLLLLFLYNQKRLLRAALVSFFLVFSLPTFLAHHKETPNGIMFPQEISAAQFIDTTYGLQTRPVVSSVYTLPDMQKYYAPEANIVFPYQFLNEKQAETLLAVVQASSLDPQRIEAIRQVLLSQKTLTDIDQEYLVKSLRFVALNLGEFDALRRDPAYRQLISGFDTHTDEEFLSSVLISSLYDYQVRELKDGMLEMEINEMTQDVDDERVRKIYRSVEMDKLLLDPNVRALLASLKTSEWRLSELFIFCRTRILFGSIFTESRPITPVIWEKLDRILDRQAVIYDNGLVQIYRY